MNNNSNNKRILLEKDRLLLEKDKEISDLHVLIETLQTNIMSVSSLLSKDQKKSIETHSYKWCTGWRMEEFERR